MAAPKMRVLSRLIFLLPTDKLCQQKVILLRQARGFHTRPDLRVRSEEEGPLHRGLGSVSPSGKKGTFALSTPSW